jgi:hypothetical protein
MKRGRKPEGKVKIKWTPNFAYAVGLLVTDGNLSKDGRHVVFVSKDIEQVKNFADCLGIQAKVGKTISGHNKNLSFRTQFGDILFYKFLKSIGFSHNKSKTIGEISIPKKYFFDFLRGHFDGDGTFYSYWDPRWKSSYMYYTVFLSASKRHIKWLRSKLLKTLGIKGHITGPGRGITYQLKYAKNESLKLLKNMYYDNTVTCLSRKRKKIEKALETK